MNTDDGVLLWLDMETTGLDVVSGRDKILEVGWRFTDLNFDWWEPPIEMHVMVGGRTTTQIRDSCDSFVQEMHDKSGLWRARDGAQLFPLDIIESYILTQIREVTGEGFNVDSLHPVTVAGCGVSTFDIPIIKTFMPHLAKRITYYPFDVSGVERFAQIAHTGKMRSTSKSADHRAVADIEFARNLALKLSNCMTGSGNDWFLNFPEWRRGMAS